MKTPDGPEPYKQGWRDGYTIGENERVALTIANSELRSDLREALAAGWGPQSRNGG